MPILDRLACFVVHSQAFQLEQGHGKSSALPAGQDKHLVLALIFRRHPHDLELIADAERGDRALSNASSQKGEPQLVLEGTVPAHGLFFRTIAVNDDLHRDPLFPLFVLRQSSHRVCSSSEAIADACVRAAD